MFFFFFSQIITLKFHSKNFRAFSDPARAMSDFPSALLSRAKTYNGSGGELLSFDDDYDDIPLFEEFHHHDSTVSLNLDC